uniref:Uncharacterized protein n=1 Tax=Hyaloperonospora arabidopsidis (strain Emoy2) TaxID=559515 RepID=M4BSH9_HYAAE
MTETLSEHDVAVEKSHLAESRQDQVDNDDGSSCEEDGDRAGVIGRSIAVSPSREDILDRCPPPVTVAAAGRSPVKVSPSPYCLSSSMRYKHGRRIEDSGIADSTARTQLCVAGVTTEQADRYRMSRTSGKRLRSPSKPTTLWGDPCDSYNRQSGTSVSITDAPSFSHKRQVHSAAERTFGGSSVFRTLNMDTYGWPPSESVRGQHRSVATGSDANDGERGFPRDVESEQLPNAHLQRSHSQQCSTDNGNSRMVPIGSEVFDTPLVEPRSYKKTKRVSFHRNGRVNTPNEIAAYPQPRTLPVLADKTTQTEAFLLSTWKPTESDKLDVSDRYGGRRNDQGSPLRSSTMTESEHPRQMPSEADNAAGAARVQQRHYRRTSGHLANPIMINPGYLPEPTTFRGRSSYSTMSNDKFPWR